MAKKPTPKSGIHRTTISLPESLSIALAHRYEFENPTGEDGKKIPYGQWMALKAMAQIDGENRPAGPENHPAPDMRSLEFAASDGARSGVATALGRFAGELGDVFGERLMLLDAKLEEIRTLIGFSEQARNGGRI